MIGRISGLAAATLCLATAGAAAAQSWDDFSAFCIASEGRSAPAQAAAEAAGWTHIPDAELQAARETPVFEAMFLDAVLRAPDGRREYLVLEHGRPLVAGEAEVEMESCKLISRAIKLDQAIEAFGAAFGLAPPEGAADQVFWTFSKGVIPRDESGIYGADALTLDEALRSRVIYLAGVGQQELRPSMLVFGRLRPSAGAQGSGQ